MYSLAAAKKKRVEEKTVEEKTKFRVFSFLLIPYRTCDYRIVLDYVYIDAVKTGNMESSSA